MDSFRISATGHSIKYFPQYLAKELGYFEDVDLKVSIDVPETWTQVLNDVNKGKAQAALGGIWVPSMYKYRIQDYFSFAQLGNRCPLVLVSRKPVKNFEWSQLENKVVLVPGANGSSPFLFLAGFLKKADFDMSKTTFVHDLSAPMLAELFSGGMGDVLATDLKTANSLTQKTECYHMASLVEIGGPIPWSVYYTLPELIDKQTELYGRFTLAIQQATTWLVKHNAAEAREVIRQYWPNDNEEDIIKIVDYFRENGMWSETVSVKENELHNWEQSLADGGLIESPIPYEELVDNRPYNLSAANYKAY